MITWFPLVSGGMDANPTTAMFLSLVGSKACLSEDAFMQWQGFVDSGNWTDYYKPTSGSGGYGSGSGSVTGPGRDDASVSKAHSGMIEGRGA